MGLIKNKFLFINCLILIILSFSVNGWAKIITKKSMIPITLPAETTLPDISNDYIQAVIAENGRFTLGNIGGDPNNPNDDDKILLFGHPSPWSSFTSIRIDGVDYTFGTGGTWIIPPCQQGGSLVASWEIGPQIVITQTLTIIRNFSTGRDDNLQIAYEIRNEGSSSSDIGISLMLDTMLGDNDGAPFRVLGFGEVTVETEWVSPADTIPQYFQVFDNFDDPTVLSMFSITGVGFPDPDRLVLGSWGEAYGGGDDPSAPWNYTIDSTTPFGDSAVVISWNPVSFISGQSRTYGTGYGLGGMTYVAWDPFNIGLSAPEFLQIDGSNDYVPDPFTTVCYLKNSSGDTVTGATVKFNLAPGLVFDTGEIAEKPLGDVPAEEIVQREWRIKPLGSITGYVNFSVTCYAEGKNQTITKSIYIPALPNSIHGRVTNSDAQPLVGATINIFYNGMLIATTTPFSDGTFLIEDLTPGTYQIVATSDEYADRTMPVSVGSGTDTENINVVLFRPFEDKEKLEAFCYPNPVRGSLVRIVFYTEEPAEVKVELFTTAGKRIKTYNTTTNGRGHFEVDWDLDDVANGVYLYRVTATWGGKERTVVKKIAVIKR